MTPFRLLLAVLLIASSSVVIYAFLFGDPAIRLPLVVSGLAVAGICAGILGFSMAGSAIRIGEEGRGGRATLVAFIGGLFVIGAAGALAGAIVLGILTGTA